jgi:hypothetical protein
MLPASIACGATTMSPIVVGPHGSHTLGSLSRCVMSSTLMISSVPSPLTS